MIAPLKVRENAATVGKRNLRNGVQDSGRAILTGIWVPMFGMAVVLAIGFIVELISRSEYGVYIVVALVLALWGYAAWGPVKEG
jgi:hypothetical protein